MPSFVMHEIIAKEYIRKNENTKNRVQDRDEFINGNLAPDKAPDKFKSHHTISENFDYIPEHLVNKVSLLGFLKENEIDNDFNKGQFLHLLADFLFYNAFLDRDYLENRNFSDFQPDLYYSYDLADFYLRKVFDVDYSPRLKSLDEVLKRKDERINIIEPKKLLVFIKLVSELDLEECKGLILEVDKDILVKDSSEIPKSKIGVSDFNIAKNDDFDRED